MLTSWISKSAEMHFKLPFEEAIAARLSMEDAERAFYEPFSIAIGGVVGDRPRIVVEFPMLYSGLPEPALPGVTRPKSLARCRVSIAVLGTGCRPVCGRRPRRRSMKAAPCPDRVQTIDCHPCPSFGGGRKGGLENKVLAARKAALRPRTTSLPTLADCLSGRK